jgi:hypothetical protein
VRAEQVDNGLGAPQLADTKGPGLLIRAGSPLILTSDSPATIVSTTAGDNSKEIWVEDSLLSATEAAEIFNFDKKIDLTGS